MRQTILNCISLKPGIGAIQLALDVMSYVNPSLFDSSKYENELQALIDTREIKELTYVRVITGLGCQVKSIFFPKDVSFSNLEQLLSWNENYD